MTKTFTPKMGLIGIAWPIFVEQTLRMLIGTVDTFMVSHVSDGAVAALGVANQIIVFFLIAFNFIGIEDERRDPRTTSGPATEPALTRSPRTPSR